MPAQLVSRTLRTTLGCVATLHSSHYEPHHEIASLEALRRYLSEYGSLKRVVLLGIDLRQLEAELVRVELSDTLVVGCHLSRDLALHFAEHDVLLFPNMPDLPFQYRARLYSAAELFDTYEVGNPASYAKTLDARVDAYYRSHGKSRCENARTTLAYRLHDHGITDALQAFVAGKKLVAIMGGHSMLRSEPDYAQVAKLARGLARRGYLLASGGGPGAMEATHLGAWFSKRDEAELEAAIAMLAVVPSYKDVGGWLDTTFAVQQRFPAVPGQTPSLGIPTWLYGHEPPTAFASHIAKYFANSVREDGLLEIATHGVIYSPGSAGTIQEVFQDTTQNHYETIGFPSPMVFLGREFWTKTRPVVPLLKGLAEGRRYHDLIHVADDIDEVLRLIASFEVPELR
jgi:predicted Rossmann-fold nucleotide-binding protein